VTARIENIRTEGLGDSTYVVIHDGLAVIVDPQRDYDRFEHLLDETDSHLRFVLETHLHNDYVSGGKALAEKLDAELVLPAGAAPSFKHRPAFHYEDIEAGSIRLRPIHTPGHTPEHMSYLLIVDDEIAGVFSGGSLLVGSAGRTDLLGKDRAETLTRLQHLSVNRLAGLPEHVGLYPTHGAGSFCTASGTGELTSTIGDERKTNPTLSHTDEDSFVKAQLAGLVPYPSYYRHMGPINLMGPPPPPDLETSELDRSGLDALGDDVVVVDMRPEKEYASGHIRGSIGIPLRDDFGVWVGWVLPYQTPIALVADRDQSLEEARRQLLRIGFDDIRGVILGLSEWESDLVTLRTTDAGEFAAAVEDGNQILDARAPDEWDTGIIEGSVLQYTPDVAQGPSGELDSTREVYVACGTGYRATIAASFLEKGEFDPVVLVDAGVTEVLNALSNR
jgi:hydroxyacylglutathione hydrolase